MNRVSDQRGRLFCVARLCACVALVVWPTIIAGDAAGNVTRTENDYELAYDYENRLVEVKDPSNTTIATYTYDALGRRVSQTKDGAVTHFYYDGENVIAEYDGSDDLQRYYVHGPTYVDERLLIREQGQEYYYLLTALYSVSGLAAPDGTTVQRYTYDAYGLPSDPCADPFGSHDPDGDVDLLDFAVFQACFSGEDIPHEPGCEPFDAEPDEDVDLGDYELFQYWAGSCPLALNVAANPYFCTGRRLDFDIRDVDGSVTGTPGWPLLNLYHYRARAYDPWDGRFLQRDPALYRESLNLYEYVASNPASGADPTGASLLDLLGGFYSISLDMRARSAAVGMTLLGYVRAFTEAVSLRSQILTGMIDTASRMGQRGIDFLIRAERIMQGTSGRVFTSSTYREAYIWLRGGIQQGFQVHHIFPQSFAEWFARRGINVHVPLWLQEIEAGAHARLSAAYNVAWTAWIRSDAGRNATMVQIVDKARELSYYSEQ